MNIVLFWILSEIYPNNGGKRKAVNGNIETISWVKEVSIPKYNKYLGVYVNTAIPLEFVTKTEIKIRITDFFDIINILTP